MSDVFMKSPRRKFLEWDKVMEPDGPEEPQVPEQNE